MTQAILRLCAALLLALTAVGCGEDDTTEETPPVSSVEGAVLLADFCGHFNELYCNASADCCSPLDQTHDSVDACIAANPCPTVLGDALVQDGVIAYDPELAGEYLRGLERDGAACEADAAEVGKLPFLEGTLGEGGDCSPFGDGLEVENPLRRKTCAPGLFCAIDADGITGACRPEADPAPPLKAIGETCDAEIDTCAGGFCDSAAGACAAKLAGGIACADDAACLSGRCVDPANPDADLCEGDGCTCAASADVVFCPAEPPAPPANPNYENITRLCIKAGGCGTCGSSKPTKLKWRVGHKLWECSINSIDKKEEKCCTPVRQDNPSSGFAGSGMSQFRINGTDNGLKVTKLSYRLGGTTYTDSSFYDADLGLGAKFEGCNWTFDNCGSFWVDTNGHGRCETVAYDYTDGDAWCID